MLSLIIYTACIKESYLQTVDHQLCHRPWDWSQDLTQHWTKLILVKSTWFLRWAKLTKSYLHYWQISIYARCVSYKDLKTLREDTRLMVHILLSRPLPECVIMLVYLQWVTKHRNMIRFSSSCREDGVFVILTAFI